MSMFAEMNLPQSLAQRLIQAGITTPYAGATGGYSTGA